MIFFNYTRSNVMFKRCLRKYLCYDENRVIINNIFDKNK